MDIRAQSNSFSQQINYVRRLRPQGNNPTGAAQQISIVLNLINGTRKQKENFAAGRLPSGMYIYRLETESFVAAKKCYWLDNTWSKRSGICRI
jgi:hypothetical protein